MQAQAGQRMQGVEGGYQADQRALGGLLPGRTLAFGDEAAGQQQGHCALAVGTCVQPVPVLERPAPAHGMQAADEAPQLAQRGRCFEFRLAACTAHRHRKAMGAVRGAMQGQRGWIAKQGQPLRVRGGTERQRRYHRHLGRSQLQRKGVFLDDLRVMPSPRPVELGHHGLTVFQEHLEDPVLVRVELQHTAIATQPYRVQRGQDLLRIESGVVQSVAQRPVQAVHDDATQVVRHRREFVARVQRAAQPAKTAGRRTGVPRAFAKKRILQKARVLPKRRAATPP